MECLVITTAFNYTESLQVTPEPSNFPFPLLIHQQELIFLWLLYSSCPSNLFNTVQGWKNSHQLYLNRSLLISIFNRLLSWSANFFVVFILLRSNLIIISPLLCTSAVLFDVVLLWQLPRVTRSTYMFQFDYVSTALSASRTELDSVCIVLQSFPFCYTCNASSPRNGGSVNSWWHIIYGDIVGHPPRKNFPTDLAVLADPVSPCNYHGQVRIPSVANTGGTNK